MSAPARSRIHPNNEAEPAQSQVAANGAGYILLKLLSEGKIKGSALLSYTYELVEMATEKSMSPYSPLKICANTDTSG